MLRPERIRLSRVQSSQGTSLAATVSDLTFLGSHVQVAAMTRKGAPLNVRLPFGHDAISGLSRGDAVWLSFDASNARAFA